MIDRFETFTLLLNRINRNIRKIKNREMEEYHLRSPHVACLYHLYLAKELTSTALCERCEEDKATISRSLDYLEKNGYLVCRTTAAKRYNSPLVLTEKGMEAGKQITEKINRILDEVSIDLSEDERAALYRSLGKISERLERVSNGFYELNQK